jgi:HD superfamily phosphohydrolase/tRNA A-37 threonylcarbamoyl transferase component Bud32
MAGADTDSLEYPPELEKLSERPLEGGYRVVERDGHPDLLGSGAWAHVFRAEGPLGDPKALKILRPQHAQDADAVKRFTAEAKRLISVRHPNIVSLEITGEWNDDGKITAIPYFIMEFVDGRSLEKWAKKRHETRIFPAPDQTAALIRQLATALGFVHSQNIYHLDLKPENILVSNDGTPKIGDFGLARAFAPDLGPDSPLRLSIGGRNVEAMHPRFRRLLGEVVPDSALEPVFDLFGLGYSLAQVRDCLVASLDPTRRWLFDALILRLTVADTNDDPLPGRSRFQAIERDIPEYDNADNVLESVSKIENPHLHLVEVPELRMAFHPAPPVRIAGGIHVPTTDRLRQVIDTAVFQRLAWMRQLDLVHTVYPGAVHTRLEHALGSYYYALRYVRRLLEYPYFIFHYSSADIEAVLLAALLHDIGHYPMAHAVGDSQELAPLDSHEDVGYDLLTGEESELASSHDREELLDALSSWAPTPEQIALIAFREIPVPEDAPTPYLARRHNLLHSIISGPLDVDKMHYLQMDSCHTGNPVGGSFDAEQLIDSLAISHNRDTIAVTAKGVAAAESFLYARYRMHIDVYWHHTVRGARKVVARSIDHFTYRNREAKALVRSAALRLTDREFLEFLFNGVEHNWAARSLIEHLMTQSVWQSGQHRTVRPIRGLFKRVRTYYHSPDQPHDLSRSQIYAKLEPGRRAKPNLLRYEAAIAKELSAHLRSRLGRSVFAWEVIIDVPVPDSWYTPLVADPRFHPRHESEPLTRISLVAQHIADDFARNSDKIRLFVSPEVEACLEPPDMEQLNDWVLKAIRSVEAGARGSRRRTQVRTAET